MTQRMLGAVAFVLCLTFAQSADKDVSRKKPKFYRKIADKLTPLKSIPKDLKSVRKDHSGVILLDENYIQVRRNSFFSRKLHLYRVRKVAYKVLNEAGIRSVETEYVSYYRGEQKIYLIEAKVIQPDGSEIAVEGDGAFIKHPRKSSDAPIYTNRSQLVLVFPKVKTGSIVTYTVAIEQEDLRMKNELCGALGMLYGWPIGKYRCVYDLPNKMAAKLKVTNIGTGLPKLTKTPSKSSTTFDWTGLDIPSRRIELDRAPSYQFGPCIWFTTLQNWTQLATWFQGLCKGRDELNNALKIQVDKWTKDAKDEDEIIRILYTKAANEVRYVGLEFGVGGRQPYNCNEVWANRYGDCKDKANLLHAMLKYKGITSQIALANTRSPGRIIKECPSYQQFNHAIVAIKRGDKYVVCDPTIKYMVPTDVGPATKNREVFLATSEKAEFVHTSSTSNGRYDYQLDLTVNRNGGLSGWLTLETSGYYGADYYDYIMGIDEEDLAEELSGYARQFFPAAKVIDVDAKQAKKDFADRTRFRIYFIVPSMFKEDRKQIHLPFSGHFFLRRLANDSDRETPLYQDRYGFNVRVKYNLPDGWAAPSLPHPFSVKTDYVTYTAAWKTTKSGVESCFSGENRKYSIPVDQFKGLQNAVSATRAWCSQPLAIKQGAQSAQNSKPAQTVEMELMPTGRGQMRLVEERFPKKTNDRLRRLALKKVMQWFPKDTRTLFEAETEIARLEKGSANQAKALRLVLKRYDLSKIDPYWTSWCRYLLACSLEDMEKRDEARKAFLEVAEDANTPEFRRGWSYYAAGLQVRNTNKQESVRLFKRSLEFSSNAVEDAIYELALILLPDSKAAELSVALDAAIAAHPGRLQVVVGNLVQLAEGYAAELKPREFRPLKDLLTALITKHAKLSAFSARLKKAELKLKDIDKYAELQQLLKAAIARHKPSWYPLKDLKTPGTREAIEAEMVKRWKANQFPAYISLCLDLLTKYPANPKSFSRRFWNLTSKATDFYLKDPLTAELIEIGVQTPESDKNHHELIYLRGRFLNKIGRAQEALKVYRTLIEGKDSRDYLTSSVYASGLILQKQGKYEEALKLYKLINGVELWERSYNVMNHAVIICLALDKEKEAMEWLARLRKIPKETLKTITGRVVIKDLLRISTKPEEADKFWAAQKKWWPHWNALEKLAGIKATPKDVFIPLINDLQQAGVELREVIKRKQKEEMWDQVRLFAHAARWSPAIVGEMSYILSLTKQLSPELSTEIDNVRLHINLSFRGTTDKEEKIRLVQLAVQYYANKQYDDCRKMLELYGKKFDYLKNYDIRDSHYVSTSLFLAHTTGKGRNKAIALAEKFIPKNTHIDQRWRQVIFLAALYNMTNQKQKRLQLLKREVKNPTIKNSYGFDDLKDMLKDAQREALKEDGLNRGVTEWFRDNKPAWFDYASPKNLKGKKLDELDKLAHGSDQRLTGPERFKAQMLIALDPKLDFKLRYAATRGAMRYLSVLEPQRDAFMLKLMFILNNPNFPKALRKEIFSYELERSFNNFDKNDFLVFTMSPLYKELPAAQKKNWEEWVAREKLIEADFSKLKEAADKAMKADPFTFDSRITADLLFYRYLRKGEYTKAEELSKKIIERTKQVLATDDLYDLKLGYARDLSLSKRLRPIYNHLVSQLTPRVKDLPDADRALLRRGPSDSPRRHLTYREKAIIAITKIRHGRCRETDLRPAFKILQYLHQNIENRPFVLKLLIEALDLTQTDSDKCKIIDQFRYRLDWDDEKTRQTASIALDKHFDPQKFPRSAKNISFLRTSAALRLGQPINPSQALIGNYYYSWSRFAMEIEYYLQHKDKGMLEKLLEDTSNFTLLSSTYLPRVMKAAALVATPERQKLYREIAERRFEEELLANWVRPSYASTVIRLSEAIWGEPRYSREWFKHMVDSYKCLNERLTLQVLDASLRKDWKALNKFADKHIELFPTFYNYYRYRGIALNHLGDTDGAIRDLEVYTHYSHNELEYPESVELLKRLRKKAAAPIAQ